MGVSENGTYCPLPKWACTVNGEKSWFTLTSWGFPWIFRPLWFEERLKMTSEPKPWWCLKAHVRPALASTGRRSTVQLECSASDPRRFFTLRPTTKVPRIIWCRYPNKHVDKQTWQWTLWKPQIKSPSQKVHPKKSIPKSKNDMFLWIDMIQNSNQDHRYLESVGPPIQRDLCRGREVVFASHGPHGLLWAAQKGALCTTPPKSHCNMCCRFQHVNMLQMLSCTRISIWTPKECDFGRRPTCNRSNSLKSLNLLFFKVNVVPALLAKDCCGHLLVKSGPLSCWQDGYVEARTEDISRMPHDATRCHRGWHWSSGQILVESEASTDPVISVRYGSAEGSKPLPNSGRCGIKIQDCSY